MIRIILIFNNIKPILFGFHVISFHLLLLFFFA